MDDTIVLYTYPEIGHVISTVELGKLILRRHGHQFAITVLLTVGFADTPSITSYIDSVFCSHPPITFRRLPPVSVDPANLPRSHAPAAFDKRPPRLWETLDPPQQLWPSWPGYGAASRSR